MKAKVTKPFNGAPDGQIYGKDFAVGDIVEGDLATVAVREKWAVELSGKAAEGASENKAEGDAAENKSKK